LIRFSAFVPWSGATAKPMLTPIVTRMPSISIGCAIEVRI